MPKSFEKFSPVERKEKSPENEKENEALELIKKIEEIKKRMTKEGETIEDYQKITKLLKQIELLYGKPETKKAVSWEKIEDLEKIFSKEFRKNIYYPSFSPTGDKIMVVEGDYTLKIYDLTGREMFSKEFEKPIGCLTFNPTGEEIMVKEGDKSISLYKIKGQKRE